MLPKVDLMDFIWQDWFESNEQFRLKTVYSSLKKTGINNVNLCFGNPNM